MKITFRFTLVIAFCASWSVLTACNVPQLTSRPSSIQKTPTTTRLPFSITDLKVGQAPSYQGITPGVSHKHDVLVLWGSPDAVRMHEVFESLHYFDGSTQETVLVKNDVVLAITSNALWKQLAQGDYVGTLKSLSQTLGASEVITPTLLGDPITVFPRHGLAVDGFYAQVFQPTYLQEYQTLWGKLPLGYDPFPLIPSVEAVGIRPGQTTRSEVAQLLGAPDQIVFQDRGAPWWYFVEPDMLGRLHIFFNADDKVESMSIAPFYQSPRPLLLEDVVKQYGPPEVVALFPGFEGARYERQVLVYPKRGMTISTICVTPDCNVVRRNAPVVQKYYFQPKTLEEYKAELHSQNLAHGPAYIEWHGFDE